MNLVDSSGWLEYFANGCHANVFAPIVTNTQHLIIPSICIYEVFKRVLQQQGQDRALEAAAIFQQGKIIDLDFEISLSAAKISTELKLAMADSIILATARKYHATIWTLDADFAQFKEVRFIKK